MILRRQSGHGRRGQVVHVTRRGRHEIDHLDRLIGRHAQPPLADACAQLAGQIGEARIPGLKLLCGQSLRRAGCQSQLNRAPGGRGTVIVAALDRHRCRRIARVDQPQTARLGRLGGGIEDRHQVLVTPAGCRNSPHRVVHGAQRAIGGAHVGRRHNLQVRVDLKAYMPRQAVQTLG